MRLSDEITGFIRELLQRSDGVAELQRGELADKFQCAPSQINYVIATRFSPEYGFLVQSRRGGGGYIRITRLRVDRRGLLMHTINAIGSRIDARSASALLQNLLHTSALEARDAALILSASGDNALRPIPQPLRDEARATILKQCLLVIMERSEPS